MATTVIRKLQSGLPLVDKLRRNKTRQSRNQSTSRFTLSHPKLIPWIESPIEEPQRSHDKGRYAHVSSHGHREGRQYDTQHEEPELKRNHESSIIQLFFDLFFVANLTTFTGVHEVNDTATLQSYIGFFALLWFTWFQVAIYDIRFALDSVLERLFKALQFGVMTGFAVVGPAFHVGFDDSEEKQAGQAVDCFRTLALILMASRLILACQYLMVMFLARHYQKAILPLALHVLVMFVSAIIFLGTRFAFTLESGSQPLAAWYTIIAIEACAVLLISNSRKFLSFRRTCIVERLGLLTLIILGEGVIGLCGSVQKVGSSQTWTSDLIAMIICSVLVIYTMWMLYFDQAETDVVGTVRQQAWMLSHFPYHLGILFLVEGCSQLTLWRKVINTWFTFLYQIFSIPSPDPNAESLESYAEALKNTTESFYAVFEQGIGELKYQPDTAYLEEIVKNITQISTTNLTEFQAETYQYAYSLWESAAVFATNNIGFMAPARINEQTTDADTIIDGLLTDTFATVLLYFFVASSLALGMTAILMVLGKRHKVAGEWLNIGFRLICVLGLVILAGVLAGAEFSSTYNGQDFTDYFLSPWILPTVTILFLLAVVVDYALRSWSHKIVTQKNLSGVETRDISESEHSEIK